MGQYKHISKTMLVIATLGLLTLITACGGTSGKSGTKPGLWQGDDYYTYGPNGLRQRNCTNCSYSNVVADAVGLIDSNELEAEIGVSVYSSNQYNSSDYYFGSSNYTGNFTNGQVEVLGVMNVFRSQPYYGDCILPTGSYQVQTLQPGQFYGLTITSNVSLEALHVQSGARLTLSIDSMNLLKINSFKGVDGYNYQLGFWGYANIQLNDRYGTCNVGRFLIGTPY